MRHKISTSVIKVYTNTTTVDGSEILHQLRLVLYPIISRVFYIQPVVSRISSKLPISGFLQLARLRGTRRYICSNRTRRTINSSADPDSFLLVGRNLNGNFWRFWKCVFKVSQRVFKSTIFELLSVLIFFWVGGPKKDSWTSSVKSNKKDLDFFSMYL